MLCFFVLCWFFPISTFSKNSFSVSSNLDPDQAWHFVRPDLDPNCLRRLSAQVGKELRLIWQQPCKSSQKKLLPRVKKSTVTSVGFFVKTVNRDTIKSFTCQWHLLFSAMHRSKGRGDRGSWPPTSWKITTLWSSLAILVQILWKIAKLPSQR